MHASVHRCLQDPVIGRVELDFVDASPVAIEGSQARAMQIGLLAQRHEFSACTPTQIGQLGRSPAAAVALDVLPQYAVRQPEIAGGQGRGEVVERVGVEVGGCMWSVVRPVASGRRNTVVLDLRVLAAELVAVGVAEHDLEAEDRLLRVGVDVGQDQRLLVGRDRPSQLVSSVKKGGAAH